MEETDLSSNGQISNRTENPQSNVTESNIPTVYSYPVNSSPTTSFDLDPSIPETPRRSSNEHHDQPIFAQFQSPQMLEPNALSSSPPAMQTLEVVLCNLPESVATLELSDVEQHPELTNTLPTSPASLHFSQPDNSAHINREVFLTAALTENEDYDELMRLIFSSPHVPDGAIESFHFPLRVASSNAQTTHQPSPDTSPTSNPESSGDGQISFGQTQTMMGPSERDITLFYNRSVSRQIEVSRQIHNRFNESQISSHRTQVECVSSSTQTPVTPRVPLNVNTFTYQTSSTVLPRYPVHIDRARVLIFSETPEEHSLIVKIKQFFHIHLQYTHIEFYGNLRAETARMRLCAEVLDASKNRVTDLLFVVVVGRVRLPNRESVYMRDNTRWTVSEMRYALYVATDDEQRRAALELLSGKPKVLCVLAWPYRQREAPLYQPRSANYDATASSLEGYNVVPSPRNATRQPAQSLSVSQRQISISHPNQSLDPPSVVSPLSANSSLVVAGPLDALSHPLVNQSGGADAEAESGNLRPLHSQTETAAAERAPECRCLPSYQCDELHFMSSKPEKLVAELLAVDPLRWTYTTLPDLLTILHDTPGPAAPAEEAVAVEAPQEPDRLVYSQKATLRRQLFLVPPANSFPIFGTPAHPVQQ